MNGYLVIGDVHAVFKPFAEAADYALKNNLQLVSVGDLNDQNDQGAQVFGMMRHLMDQGKAVGVKGNHEWKVKRYRQGNPVKIGENSGSRITIEQMEADPRFGEDFDSVVARMEDVIELPGGVVVAHGGVPRKWWTGELSAKKARGTFFYGESNGERFKVNGREYPVRTYEWADHVPAGRTVIVGHDTRPMQPQFNSGGMTPPQSVPHFYDNPQGGHVIFVDTGCGKKGTLSGVHLDSAGEFVAIENFGG